VPKQVSMSFCGESSSLSDLKNRSEKVTGVWVDF
jgi:hypothetical protein